MITIKITGPFGYTSSSGSVRFVTAFVACVVIAFVAFIAFTEFTSIKFAGCLWPCLVKVFES